MKKLFLSCLLLAFVVVNLSAQNPKRHLFLEHFTNTVCSICSTKNPPFFDKIADYPDDIHHISIHPPVPYTTCEFYNENTFENESLAINYGINGTPKVYLWGESVSTTTLLPDATLEAALDQTSPISVDITESGTTVRNITVAVNAFEDIPAADDNRLFVAMVEATVFYDAPNGENVHHNVFRKLLTPVSGLPIGSIITGSAFDFQESFTIPSNYVENEIYAIAWVQNVDTKEVLNSGATSSAFISSNEAEFVDKSVFIYPNPTIGQLRIDIGENKIEKIELLNIDGKISMSVNAPIGNTTIDISHLLPGVYFVNFTTTDGILTEKITKF